jgi:hypothetical protein
MQHIHPVHDGRRDIPMNQPQSANGDAKEQSTLK